MTGISIQQLVLIIVAQLLLGLKSLHLQLKAGDFNSGATITKPAAECNFVHDSFTDEGTITCLNSNTVDTTVDNIAEPNSSGLSVNNYEAFHIPVNGRVFNNSVSGATLNY